MASSRREPSLAHLIRRSPALDASARRQWLAVLPHLTPDDRERLREILLERAASPPSRCAPRHGCADARERREGEGPSDGGPAARRGARSLAARRRPVLAVRLRGPVPGHGRQRAARSAREEPGRGSSVADAASALAAAAPGRGAPRPGIAARRRPSCWWTSRRSRSWPPRRTSSSAAGTSCRSCSAGSPARPCCRAGGWSSACSSGPGGPAGRPRRAAPC